MLIADEDKAALSHLGSVLEGLGHEVTPYAVSVAEAIELISTEDPDLAIVVVHKDDEHALALIQETVEYASGPVIAQTPRRRRRVRRPRRRARHLRLDRLDGARGRPGRDRGRPAPQRGGARLQTKVDQLESALERRAVIERAKGILMERHGIDERAAFELMRDHARAQSRRVVDVAVAVSDGHALLPRHA